MENRIKLEAKHEVAAKALLLSYQYLEEACADIDRAIVKKGMSAFSYKNSANGIYDSICELTARKINYCNIKVMVDYVLSCMKDSTTINFRFLQGLTIEESAAASGITTRTINRHQKTQLSGFAKLLFGIYGEDKVFGIIKKDNWLKYLCRQSVEFKGHLPKKSQVLVESYKNNRSIK